MFQKRVEFKPWLQGWGSPLAVRNGFDEDDGFQNSPLGLESCERDGCSMDSDESMADQNVHHRVVQNTYKLQFGSSGEWQSDMNDGIFIVFLLVASSRVNPRRRASLLP